ncbi:capsular biosynthesis protein [Legionella qingyii]|uniref:Capsular biosynthesis protein n=1 Tax=Legionella qingyii TaxID=2184757 RepID=A0A317U0V1_9GAMM|nr:capsular biosynthesis protein [Legionella qingyii]PWY55461.1 capsular biosynthesis protein [Legionella qingyii]RUR21335.1 capsular biosynthesis protein [Legionella qingyii]RUR24559.1 capsular biosynthesis protein [Legionella qingyii]
MYKNSCNSIFQGKNILLLQGPVGPFFAHLAASLKAQGARVYKINFNAGDCFFFLFGAVTYRQSIEEWPLWLEDFLQRFDIDIIFQYGDCRPIHRIATEIAARHGIEVAVFEEGYIRPNFVTLEYMGVNANSHAITHFHPTEEQYQEFQYQEQQIGRAYWQMVWYGFCYFTVGGIGKFLFKNNVHHRPLTILEAGVWLRSAWRKYWYKWREADIEQQLLGVLRKRYFLVPLQVFSDYQVTAHSGFKEVEQFIELIIDSFAQGSMNDTFLVFKHHPMDRGYVNYTDVIRRLAIKAQIKERVMYIHDQHLPSLLENALGVVVINSSVGISALHHNVPTFVCGDCFYNIPGLTYQGTLDDFWISASHTAVDRDLYKKFLNFIITKTQLNGSFYKKFKKETSFAGLIVQKYNAFFLKVDNKQS